MHKGDLVRIQASDLYAGNRTKNRVRENGPDFVFHDIKFTKIDGTLVEAILVESASTGWMGWLPIAELKHVEKSKMKEKQ